MAEVAQIRRHAADGGVGQNAAAEQFHAQKYGGDEGVGGGAEHGGVADAGGKLCGDAQKTAQTTAEAGAGGEKGGHFAAQKAGGEEGGGEGHLQYKIGGGSRSFHGKANEIGAEARIPPVREVQEPRQQQASRSRAEVCVFAGTEQRRKAAAQKAEQQARQPARPAEDGDARKQRHARLHGELDPLGGVQKAAGEGDEIGGKRGKARRHQRPQAQGADDGHFQSEKQGADGGAEQGGKARRHAGDEQDLVRPLQGHARADRLAHGSADLDAGALSAHAGAEQVRTPRPRELEGGVA